jgi:hypothetical protein
MRMALIEVVPVRLSASALPPNTRNRQPNGHLDHSPERPVGTDVWPELLAGEGGVQYFVPMEGHQTHEKKRDAKTVLSMAEIVL